MAIEVFKVNSDASLVNPEPPKGVTWRQLREVINSMTDEQIDGEVIYEHSDELYTVYTVNKTEEDDEYFNSLGVEQFFLY